MMDITAILHMHAELSLTAVFILMFLLDLFLPAPQRHWLRPMACILLTIQLLANLWPEEVTLFGGMYHSTPMASVLKSILTIGTILVFLQADTWLKREDTRHRRRILHPYPQYLAGYVFHGKRRALPAILPWIGIGNRSYGLSRSFR